jgi:hypothetical protein
MPAASAPSGDSHGNDAGAEASTHERGIEKSRHSAAGEDTVLASERAPISILSAMYGPSGNGADVTARLAEQCNGRWRCAHRVDDEIIGCHMGSLVGVNATATCTNEYVTEWTCGGPEAKHRLVAKAEPGVDPRVRLSCGLGQSAAEQVEPSSPEPLEPGRGAKAGPSEQAGAVHGIVVPWGRKGRVAGVRVAIGKQSTTTDGQGKFAFERVPATYDVMIAEPNPQAVTLYLGLATRSPILRHETRWSVQERDTSNRASVTGLLAGEPPLPPDARRIIEIHYLSDALEDIRYQRNSTELKGHAYGPVVIEWSGESSIAGKLVAYSWSDRPKHPGWLTASIADVDLDLTDADVVYQNLKLRPVTFGRIAGTAEMYEGCGVSYLSVSYHLPNTNGGIHLRECPGRGKFDCQIPDLGSLGGSYCVFAQDSYGRARVTKCGATIGMSDVRVKALSPPKWQAPVAGVTVNKGSTLAWTGVDDAIYMIEVKPDFGEKTPVGMIRFLTADKQLAWPELNPLGVKIPGSVKYKIKVSALVPYASVDELASSQGPLVKSGVDFQQLESEEVQVNLVGPVEKPKLPAPSNVRDLPNFPDGLPTCSSTRNAKSLAAIETKLLGKKIALRGTLSFGPAGWACTLMGCVDHRGPCCVNHCSTRWTVMDPAVPIRLVSLKRGLSAMECEIPKSPQLEVVATGTLLEGSHVLSHADSYLLDDANLCVVRHGR